MRRTFELQLAPLSPLVVGGRMFGHTTMRRLTLLSLAAASMALGGSSCGGAIFSEEDEDLEVEVDGASEAPLANGVVAEADTYVRSGSYGNSNFGQSSSIQVDLNDGETIKRGFLRFAIGQVGTIRSAQLRLFVTNGSSDSSEVYLISNNSWNERELVWNNQPALDGAKVATIRGSSSGRWIQIDVSRFASSGNKLSLAFVGRSSNGFVFASRESSRSPELILDVLPPTDGGSDGGTQTNQMDGGTHTSVDGGSQVDAGSPRDSGVLEVHSPCLDATQIMRVADVPDGERFQISPLNNVTYDMRGFDVRAAPDSALIDFLEPANMCVTGAAAIAKYPAGFQVNWRNVKVGDGTYGPYDEGGFHTAHPKSGNTIFDRIYIEGVEDGLMIARIPGDSTQKWELRDSYLKSIVDDAVENDGFRSGKIIDVLSEGTHMFYSASNSIDTLHSILIQDSVIGFECKADPRTDKFHGAGACPDGTSTQYMFKVTSSAMPQITVSNTVIHHPAIPRSGASALCMPSGQYSNVTIVWTGSVSYPCSLPAGVTLTKDINVYNKARADWLARHGCTTDGSDCAFLHR